MFAVVVAMAVDSIQDDALEELAYGTEV